MKPCIGFQLGPFWALIFNWALSIDPGLDLLIPILGFFLIQVGLGLIFGPSFIQILFGFGTYFWFLKIILIYIFFQFLDPGCWALNIWGPYLGLTYFQAQQVLTFFFLNWAFL